MNTRVQRVATFALPAVLLAPAGIQADAPEPPYPPDGVAPATESPRYMSATASIGVTNRYYFRGIVQEREGAIVQPMVELGGTLFEGDGSIAGLSLTTGSTLLPSSSAPPPRRSPRPPAATAPSSSR